ncbi:MAG: hypothetical protein H0V17_35350 [Deltaproteobacteria bacterium]|nr:hypothetical protein [Deltaproteobacteria bacterium]
MKIQITFLAVGLLVGCGGKKDEPAGGDKTSSGKPVEDKPVVPSGPFAEFGRNDDILMKFQGAWVLETGSLGHYEAWEIKGNKVTSWDGKKEQTRELQIDAPCAAQVVEKSNGGSSSNHMTFVFEGDKLHTGMGDAGIKKGDKILACGSGKIFVWDGKACVAHANMFGRWENEATECKLEGTKFTAKRPGMGNMSSEFQIAGDLLLDDQMKRNKVEKAASYAEAKTKLETFKK